MSRVSEGSSYQFQVWDWARAFGHRLTGHPYPTFFLVLGGSDRPTSVVCGTEKAGEEALVIPEEDLAKWRSAPSWIHFHPVGGPETQFLRWRAVPRARMERLVGEPLRLAPSEEFPETLSLRF
jgi:hypothetical protein